MRILCVIDSLGSGGAQRQLVELALVFKERGNDVSFLTYHEDSFYDVPLKNASIETSCIKEPSYFKRILKMRSFIRKGHYDVVISFLEAASFICEVAGFPYRRWKLIVGERSANPKILKSKKLKFYRWAHLVADYVVANSNANLDMVRQINPLLPSRKCKVIYNMIDLEKWKPSPAYAPKSENKLVMVVAASQRYLKNLNGLVEAVNLLDSEEKVKIRIDWYGDGIIPPYTDNSFIEAIEKIKQYNLAEAFNFYPATQNIREKVQMADAVGLFSFYEGLPNAVCEGMACGKTVIATKVSDIPRLLDTVDLLCIPDNHQSIARSLKYLLSMSKDELVAEGMRNRDKAIELFSKKNTSQSYYRLFSNDFQVEPVN